MEKISTPRNIIIDKINTLKQTVETFKGLTTDTNNSNINNRIQINDYCEKISTASHNEPINSNTALLNVPINSPFRSSVSSSSSASSSTSNEPYTIGNHMIINLVPKSPPLASVSRPSPLSNKTPPTSPLLKYNSSTVSSPPLLNNIKQLTDRISGRTSLLRRHLSDNNQETSYDTSSSQPIIGAQIYNRTDKNKNDNNDRDDLRSRALIRQSTDTTCTFPIRRTIRRQLSVETVEIPGLNGVKVVRYLHDNLGRLQPDLYKQIPNTDPSYVQKRNLNPSFQETFQFSITRDELYKRTLLLAIYDFGRITKRSLIGTVKVDELQSVKDLMINDVSYQKSIVPGTEKTNLYRIDPIE
ncbi:unnamed protein product [Didymodactylos carnosus]|uniref:C2 domain-containing protein n=1 Tax=Didymodactylos carnosus TaxID=1234261 RepID=A0A8S2IIB3_9BILA|nr:unnamed protein product [Didymodactylos carnosus]CAF3736214.1 unnamed protein product [Didymodactylos carnosus]